MFSIPVGFIDLLEQTAGAQALPLLGARFSDFWGRHISAPLIYLQYFTAFADSVNYTVFKLEKR